MKSETARSSIQENLIGRAFIIWILDFDLFRICTEFDFRLCRLAFSFGSPPQRGGLL
jgi:hypothetical protein